MSDYDNCLTRAEASALAEDAAKKAIAETFKLFGVNTEDFESVEHFRATIDWARRYKRLSERIGGGIVISIITVLSGGFLTIIGLGFKDWFHK